MIMWQNYIQPIEIEQALRVLAQRGKNARIVAGATDLILELEGGVRQGVDTLIDITRIPDLDRITLDEEDWIHLGPMVTHNRAVASKLIREYAFPLAQACWQVGAPQIRNRGTIAGNLITASPANDSITPLMALGAHVTLRSIQGERVIALEKLFKGVRKTVMKPDEILVKISFPAMDPENQRGMFYKVGLRKAQAISVLNLAAVLTFDENKVTEAVITLGSVAPTIIHAEKAEKFLRGKQLGAPVLSKAAELTQKAASPIDDIRGSSVYREYMIGVLAKRVLETLAVGSQMEGFPQNPVLLGGEYKDGLSPLGNPVNFEGHQIIETTINGKAYSFSSGYDKTLLHLLREEALLQGTKDGCSEGECGACTVFMDGVAVMSCLVPAPRAHGAVIITVEGLSVEGELHPVQRSFIDEGAVQCGYCTPGFLMSAVKLLEEKPKPSRIEIKHALTGNLCRCTGYNKIITAVELSSERGAL